MNKARILEILDVMECYQKHVDMADWFTGDKSKLFSDEECSTMACIAGFTVTHFHEEVMFGYESYFDGAQRVLDLTYKQAEKLFFGKEWPSQFTILHKPGTPEYFQNLKARVLHFVETGE